MQGEETTELVAKLRRRGPLAAGVACALAAAVVLPLSSTAQPSAPKPVKVVAGTGILRWGDTYPTASGYDKYQYVLVSRHFARAAARLPGTSLVYMSGASVQRSWSTGVSYEEAERNGWLLKDARGNSLMTRFGAHLADVGNPGYQRQFVDDVSRFLAKSHADGIFLDDVAAHPHVLVGDDISTKYPTPDAWESAMVSFVSRVGPALEQRGYYVLANAVKFVPGDVRSDTGQLTQEFWSRIAPFVSGLCMEFWQQNSVDLRPRALGPAWTQQWPGWQNLMSAAQGGGADFFGIMYGSGADTRAMRYGRASFLLDWDGAGGAFIYSRNDGSDPYSPAWVRKVGKPLARKTQRAPGVFARQYEHALVILNAGDNPVSVRAAGTRWTIGGTDALFVHSVPRAKKKKH